MAVVEVNWNPTRRQLRQFGMTCVVALPGAAWLLGANKSVLATLALAGLSLAVVGFTFPKALKPAFIALSILALPIGFVIGELAMITIYLGVFLPISLAFRIAKRDALSLRLQPDRSSYWEHKKPAKKMSSYYRQS